MDHYNLEEFYSIIQPVLDLNEFKRMKNMRHHRITRYDHCIRVAHYSYLITKFLQLNYSEATFGAVLHDFYTTEVMDRKSFMRLQLHPNIALRNASKYFTLSDREKDIIKNHMFPVTLVPPRYLESWIVDLVDDFVAIYEVSYAFRKEIGATAAIVFHFLHLK